MKVLFDVNVPRPLRQELVGPKLSPRRQWAGGELENGGLIDGAEKAAFGALLTADRNLRHQQNLSARRLGIVVLPSNKLRLLKTIAPEILRTLDTLEPEDYVEL